MWAGVPPDAVAQLLGYANATQMSQDLGIPLSSGPLTQATVTAIAQGYDDAHGHDNATVCTRSCFRSTRMSS